MVNFELFMGCLGNGITCCNKAVEEHGDYKYIAHISPKGNIKYYVNKKYIPQDAIEVIERNAKNEREKFLQIWKRLSPKKQYEIMLDELPYSITKEVLGNRNTMTLFDRLTYLESYYMTNR